MNGHRNGRGQRLAIVSRRRPEQQILTSEARRRERPAGMCSLVAGAGSWRGMSEDEDWGAGMAEQAPAD